MTANTFIAPPCSAELTTLYIDEDIVVVDKPAGLLSVPGRHPANNDSVYTRLLDTLGEIHIAHRLDRATSGLLVVARHKIALRNLNAQFARQQVDKSYRAVVYGLLGPDFGEIDQPLICDWPNRPMQKVDTDGKPAQTCFRVLQRDFAKNQTHLALKPKTGRSHQLRVHLAHIGHPIAGCEFYAHNDALEMADRLLLHASELSFIHPVTGMPQRFSCAANF